MMELQGKHVLVTGASSGMGMATAAAMADRGAEVIMLCRSRERGMEALRTLHKENPKRKLRLRIADLASLTSIRRFCQEYREEFGALDVLINNAGFISLDRQTTEDGFEREFGVNHLGHFLLTTELMDLIPDGGRVVIVASGGHKAGKMHWDDLMLTKGYNVVKAYGQSKLANVLFCRFLARRLASRNITVNCCHPGAVATQMGVDRKTGFGKTMVGMLKPFFLTPAEGAATAIFLATDDSVKDITGEYFYRCKIAKSTKRSKNMDDARRLWMESERLVNRTCS